MIRFTQRLPVILAVLLVLGIFFFAATAYAQDGNLLDGTKQVEGLLDLVKRSAGEWTEVLRKYAISMFLLLAGIQFIWTFFPLVFRQVDFGEIVGELIRFIMVIGFFWALLEHSTTWATAIVNSFRDAGSAAAFNDETQSLKNIGRVRPGDIFAVAIELAATIGRGSVSLLGFLTGDFLTALASSLSSVVILLCFAFIAAFMGLTLIESYIVINASVLFMGFGASQWTREYAVAMLRYSVSVGVKLFVLTLIVGLIIHSATVWKDAYDNTDASMWTLVGLALVCAYLAKTIPDLIQAMIMGASPGGGAAIGSMASAGIAGATAAISTLASAGMAAPAALGAMGSAAGSMAGGGGLGGLLQASMAAGQAAGVPTGTGGGAAGMASSAGGAAAQAAMPRVAGGGASAAGADAGGGGGVPQLAGPGQGGGGADGGATGGDAEGAAQSPDSDDGGGIAGADAGDLPQLSAPDNNSGGGGLSAPAAIAMGVSMLASGGTKGLGTLAAISVPGMEGAAHSSGGGGRPGSGGLPGSPSGGDDQSKGKFAVQNPTPAQGSPSASTPPAPRAGPGNRP